MGTGESGIITVTVRVRQIKCKRHRLLAIEGQHGLKEGPHGPISEAREGSFKAYPIKVGQVRSIMCNRIWAIYLNRSSFCAF